jgi:hypothetical protein
VIARFFENGSITKGQGCSVEKRSLRRSEPLLFSADLKAWAIAARASLV